MSAENNRAQKLELISITTLQYISHLCSLRIMEADGPEFTYAVMALAEVWQNYLILLREVSLRIPESSTSDNVLPIINIRNGLLKFVLL